MNDGLRNQTGVFRVLEEVTHKRIFCSAALADGCCMMFTLFPLFFLHSTQAPGPDPPIRCSSVKFLPMRRIKGSNRPSYRGMRNTMAPVCSRSSSSSNIFCQQGRQWLLRRIDPDDPCACMLLSAQAELSWVNPVGTFSVRLVSPVGTQTRG